MTSAPAHDLSQFLKQASSEISSEYRRIYASAASDPGTAGDQGEENWRQLFKDWLPDTYHVETKGRLISTEGALSPQVDVVILEPGYPKKLREKRIWMAEGVIAAFECKTTLTAAHVRSSVERCKKFKELFPAGRGSPREELTSPLIYGVLAHSHSWKAAASEPVKNIESAWYEASEQIDHPRYLLDIMCVADLATWSYNYTSWMAANRQGKWEAAFREVFRENVGVATTFFRFDRSTNARKIDFEPLGVLISEISGRMAWTDPTLRGIAGYFGKVISGSGTGIFRPWSLDVYTEYVRDEVRRGNVTNGWPGEDRWGNWTMSGP